MPLAGAVFLFGKQKPPERDKLAVSTGGVCGLDLRATQRQSPLGDTL